MKRRFSALGAITGTGTFRLVGVAVALLFAAAALTAALVYRHASQALSDEILLDLAADARAIEAEARSGGPQALVEAIAARSRFPGRSLYHLADAAGLHVGGNLKRLPPGLDPAKGGTFRYQSADAGLPGAPLERLAVAAPVRIDGVKLLVARDLEASRAFTSDLRWVFAMGLGGLTIAGLGAGLMLARFLLERLEGVNRAARAIMDGDMSRRVPAEDPGDEIDAAARNLNAMLDRIEALMAGLREVSDNIAHDLKTPLSRLRNRAEAALADGRGDAACREGLERVIEEADGLIKTFNALLLVARLEARAIEDNKESFDAAAVVRDVAEFYDPVAEAAGLRLGVEAPEGRLVLRANKQLVGQAIANLIDNAIKYGAPTGGAAAQPGAPRQIAEVSVAARSAGDRIEITVGDRGSGIPAADRERVLKRFVRLDGSRSAPGTGLGLSLVAAVARLHGGSIRLEDNVPGLRVVLELPRGAADSDGGTSDRATAGGLT